MEAELAKRMLLGVAAIQELGGNLAVAVQTQRALADEVGPRAPTPSTLQLVLLLHHHSASVPLG